MTAMKGVKWALSHTGVRSVNWQYVFGRRFGNNYQTSFDCVLQKRSHNAHGCVWKTVTATAFVIVKNWKQLNVRERRADKINYDIIM